MHAPVLITATNTDIGKTYVTLALLEALAAKGLRVGAIKPVETGVEEAPPDGTRLFETCRRLNPDFSAITLEQVVPVRFPLPAAPEVARNGQPIDYDAIRKAYHAISQVSDIVLVESAGGLLTPIDRAFFVADFARFFQTKTLFLSHDRLGCISDALVNLESLERRGIDPIWVVNRRSDDQTFDAINAPWFATLEQPPLFFPADLDAIIERILVA